MHETSFTYQLKKNQLIEVPGSFLNSDNENFLYDCKYCSFFLAKEISRYRDENTHISSHLYQFSHRRIFRNTYKDISNIMKSDSL